MIYRYDKGEIKGEATRTDEGYVRADSIVTRTGVFLYQNADGSIRRELRHPDDVFEAVSLDTLKMIPITNGHPEQKLVNSANAKELQIGTTGENIKVDGRFIRAPLVLTHADGVEALDAGRKELSLGYTVDLEKVDGEYNGERYDHRQRNIRYNHLAIVDRGRAGPSARIHLDSGDAKQTEGVGMTDNLKTVTLDGLDYKASPEVAKAYEKAVKRDDDLQTKLDAAEQAAADAKAETEKVKAALDAAKEQAETKNDAQEIQKAVKARLDLERTATKVLKADAQISEMSDADIKKAVILAKHPSANLDGQTDIYIQARFDAVAEIVANEKGVADQRQQMNERNDGSNPNDTVKARNDMADAIKNQYKGSAK
ncbi:DUF2213 domain-containing protein [Rufibacter sediminis]|uniref:DUF2213 domain-containing protein n=1 Tax=Rufibacter sediminis TaxID=2762756 RepID=A0ABR6VTX8_9BACT|nr:DUF2213 domain-containing protein [Rufibacter sediminis]MBC3540650.1 DUF2213 domain-containing protein [Rufibacter sediminis]